MDLPVARNDARSETAEALLLAGGVVSVQVFNEAFNHSTSASPRSARALSTAMVVHGPPGVADG